MAPQRRPVWAQLTVGQVANWSVSDDHLFPTNRSEPVINMINKVRVQHQAFLFSDFFSPPWAFRMSFLGVFIDWMPELLIVTCIDFHHERCPFSTEPCDVLPFFDPFLCPYKLMVFRQDFWI